LAREARGPDDGFHFAFEGAPVQARLGRGFSSLNACPLVEKMQTRSSRPAVRCTPNPQIVLRTTVFLLTPTLASG
jgi:hypothetical protein